jgi:hypothetical protein
MTRARCNVVFTCSSLIDTCTKSTDDLGISRNRVYILDVPGDAAAEAVENFKTFEQFVTEGARLNPIERPHWEEGQARKQIAYFAATSGTSGHQV